jgi:hypothetical protein
MRQIRAGHHPFAAADTPSFCDLLDQVTADEQLDPHRKADLRTAIKSLGQWLGSELTAMPAHPRYLRKRLQNVRSAIAFALDRYGLGGRRSYDGLTYEFLMAPGSEAPAEMLWFIEEKNAISAAEDATHTLHNTYSLRGAKIREPLPWSKYLNQALTMWGDKAEVMFAQHHWPTFGNKNVVELLEKQRDLYRFINDETLRLANQGMTMREIAEQIELPESHAFRIGAVLALSPKSFPLP